jgi:hypothetical protein
MTHDDVTFTRSPKAWSYSSVTLTRTSTEQVNLADETFEVDRGYVSASKT